MFTFIFKSHGQARSVCLVDTIPIGKKSYHTGKIDMDFNSQDPLVFNTYFHDNQIQLTLTEADFLEMIAYLNFEFNQYNIFFKYRGFEVVNGPVNIQSDMLNYQINDNIGSTALSPDYILMSYTSFIDNKFMFAHETGHIFGLLHTNTGTSGFESTFNTPLVCNGDTLLEGWFPSFTNDSENVTRDESSTNYNALSKGDLIHDTPAAYGVTNGEMNACYNNITQTFEYLYSAEVIDNEGDPYVNVDVTNFMNTALSFFPHLDHFTPGQGVRMRETILNEQDLLDRTTTVCSLYEPYVGGYYFAGPYNSTLHTPLFQPGFNYRFIACGSGTEIYNEPTTACETSFSYQSFNLIKQVDKYSLDLEDIYHPNHSAIVIDQLSNTPEVCYNNYNRSPGGGSVIKFNDGVYNTNITTTSKDSLQINDPYFIDNLDSGLYLINKDFCDGTQEQTAIYKND